jgi:Cu2+-exporting ATPase
MHHDPKKFRNQFWLALALTIPTMVFSHSVQMLLG